MLTGCGGLNWTPARCRVRKPAISSPAMCPASGDGDAEPSQGRIGTPAAEPLPMADLLEGRLVFRRPKDRPHAGQVAERPLIRCPGDQERRHFSSFQDGNRLAVVKDPGDACYCPRAGVSCG